MKSAVILVMVSLALPCLGATWEIDDSHTSAKFKVRHLMVSNVYGQVTGAKGNLDIDDKDLTKTTGTVTLDVNTINTSNEKRDAHLKNEDFFEATKHPTISFKITKVSKAKGGKFKMDGDLTLKGVTKPVSLKDVEITSSVKDPWGGMRRGLSGTTSIDRKDFGITWNKSLDGGGVVVGDAVEIEIAAELKEKAQAAKN
jgi:polyisoprenoid-binding protein YceI